MRSSKLLLTLVLAVALVGVAGCKATPSSLGGAAVSVPNPQPIVPGAPAVPGQPQPAVPGQPVAPTGPIPPNQPNQPLKPGLFDTIEAYLQTLKPDQRVDWRDLVNACGTNTSCQTELANFQAFLRQICPVAQGCNDKVANLLYLQRSQADIQAGIYPTTFPQVKDVLITLAAFQNAPPVPKTNP